MAPTLQRGQRYDLSTLTFADWTIGDGSGAEGYSWRDYFSADGEYLGPGDHQQARSFSWTA